tara:strand:- start:1371 stop:2060 length:690 start_codon:yes stop_codon:yes gene_type:complete
MEHHFDIEIAEKLNVNCAIIYNNIQFWTIKNKANNKNLIEGRHWTYNSVKAWNELLPYLSHKQIRTALDKLEESELIVSGVFNKAGYDRTKWYSIKGQMDLPSKANGFAQKGEPIPDNKPDNKTDSTPTHKSNNNKLYNEYLASKETTKNEESLILDYLVYRKDIKKPITTIRPLNTYYKIIVDLHTKGYDIKKCIELMKNNEWQKIDIEWIKNSGLKSNIVSNEWSAR